MNDQPDDGPRFVGVTTFVDKVGIPRSTVYEELKAGRIRSCRHRGRILIPTEEMERFTADLLAQLES